MEAGTETATLQIEKPAPTRLYVAMQKARAGMAVVGKSGFNKFDNYPYATLADYLAAIKKPLDETGLIIVNSIDEITWLDDRMTERGKAEKVCRIMLRATVIHAESGESMSVTVLGEGQDRGDKAFYKADTGARKYALANLFNLATDEDPETDSPENGTPAQRSQPSNQRSTAPAENQPRRIPEPVNWPNSSPEDIATWAESLRNGEDFKQAVLLALSAKINPTIIHGIIAVIADRYHVVLSGKSDAEREKAAKLTEWIDKTLEAVRKDDLEHQGKETFGKTAEAQPQTQATFTKPQDWPNTTIDELHKWIDTLKSAAALQMANALMFGDESPFVMLDERDPLIKHLHTNFHAKYDSLPADGKAKYEPIAQEIDGTLSKHLSEVQSQKEF
jgi:hypothetical protein